MPDITWIAGRVEETLNDRVTDWATTFVPLLRGIVEGVAELQEASFGFRFDVENLWATGWLDAYSLRFAQQPMLTTRETIRQLLLEGHGRGMSGPAIERELGAMFDVWLGTAEYPDRDWVLERHPDYRLERIVRTETIRAANAGSHEVMLGVGVKRKEWLTAIDGRERPEHAAANGQVVAIDAPFEVGGEALMFPGDPSGSPEMTINCRCTALPVLGEGDVEALLGPEEGEEP